MDHCKAWPLGTKARVPYGFLITLQILPQSSYLLIKIRKGRLMGELPTGFPCKCQLQYREELSLYSSELWSERAMDTQEYFWDHLTPHWAVVVSEHSMTLGKTEVVGFVLAQRKFPVRPFSVPGADYRQSFLRMGFLSKGEGVL